MPLQEPAEVTSIGLSDERDEHTDCRSVARWRLRNGVAKRLCIFADADIPGDDRDRRRWLAEQLRRRKMTSVKRANGFDREGPPDSGEHRVGQGHDVAATFEPPQRLYGRTLLLGRQPTGNARTENGSSGFGQGQY